MVNCKLPHSDLTQHTIAQCNCIILQFCRAEFQLGSHWAKLKVSARLHSSLGALGGNPFPSLLVSRGCLHSLACGPFLSLQSWQHHISLAFFLSSQLFLTASGKNSPLLKTHALDWVHLDNPSYSS